MALTDDQQRRAYRMLDDIWNALPAQQGVKPNDGSIGTLLKEIRGAVTQVDLAEASQKILNQKRISFGGALQYAASGGWLVMSLLRQVADDLAKLRADITKLTEKKG